MKSVPNSLPPLSRRRSSDECDLFNEAAVIPMSTNSGGDAMSDLHTKLAHIQWRKHANDKGIRKALDTAKRQHERDMMLQLSVDREGERERWTEAIVRDELARPAEISEVFLKGWEEREEQDRKRRLKEAKVHLKSINRVERAVQSKQGGVNQQYETNDVPRRGNESVEGCGSPQEEEALLLREKLRRLRVGVKEKRRGLRRGASSKDLRGTFSATSFKTGRGRW